MTDKSRLIRKESNEEENGEGVAGFDQEHKEDERHAEAIETEHCSCCCDDSAVDENANQGNLEFDDDNDNGMLQHSPAALLD